MSDRDAHSVIINIPKLRVCAKKSPRDVKSKPIKKRVSEKAIRKPSDSSLRKYSLPGNKPLQVDALKKDELLISYKLYTKEQDKIKHKQRLAIKIDEKYKIINTDLRNRLHVPDPPDDVQAVTDIDDGYFRYLNGHPLSQYIPLFKSLKFIFHKQLRVMQEVGYRRDCVLEIDVNYKREQEIYERSVQRYTVQVKQFDDFISIDYRKSMAILKKCDDLRAKVNAKIFELENLANQKFMIQSRLIGLDYLYFMQQKYGRFLYYLSPPSWRSRNRDFARSVEIEAMGFDLGVSSEEDTFNVIFAKMQEECYRGLVKPPLFFKDPKGLMDIFGAIEKQQLHHFTHVTYLTPHAKTLKGGITDLKNIIELDSALVVHMIKKFQKLVDFCDEREEHLKAKFMKILHGLFYDSVVSTDVLKLQMHLEFCFEKIYNEKPSSSTDMTLVTTAKALEKMYMDYSSKLDCIRNDNLRMALAKYVLDEKITWRQAKIAARELRLFDRLERALLHAHKPLQNHQIVPLPVVKRHVLRKSNRKPSKPVFKESIQRQLTEGEIEYLKLFTEWTENEDPANYIHSLSIKNNN